MLFVELWDWLTPVWSGLLLPVLTVNLCGAKAATVAKNVFVRLII